MTLRLVIFDVDGTLVDSQADIVGGMQVAFAQEGLAQPSRDAILDAVGLSLPEFMVRLIPDYSETTRNAIVEGYKAEYAARRSRAAKGEGSPLYPGARAALEALHRDDTLLLGIATGKSRRGLDMLLDAHDLRSLFVTHQCADNHPSKPHPSMILTCLSDTGIAPEAAVMVGDTSFDMTMARAAGVGALGVSWGYHAADQLDADHVVETFADVPQAVAAIMENT